jgi:hypothetical protein
MGVRCVVRSLSEGPGKHPNITDLKPVGPITGSKRGESADGSARALLQMAP